MTLFSSGSRCHHTSHRNLCADNPPSVSFTVLINMKWKNLSRIIFWLQRLSDWVRISSEPCLTERSISNCYVSWETQTLQFANICSYLVYTHIIIEKLKYLSRSRDAVLSQYLLRFIDFSFNLPHFTVAAQLCGNKTSSVQKSLKPRQTLCSFSPPFCSTVADKWAASGENRAEEHNLGVEGAVVPQQQPHGIRGQVLREGKNPAFTTPPPLLIQLGHPSFGVTLLSHF